eukprot:2983160-Pyramimonas_sp.AAC.1
MRTRARVGGPHQKGTPMWGSVALSCISLGKHARERAERASRTAQGFRDTKNAPRVSILDPVSSCTSVSAPQWASPPRLRTRTPHSLDVGCPHVREGEPRLVAAAVVAAAAVAVAVAVDAAVIRLRSGLRPVDSVVDAFIPRWWLGAVNFESACLKDRRTGRVGVGRAKDVLVVGLWLCVGFTFVGGWVELVLCALVDRVAEDGTSAQFEVLVSEFGSQSLPRCTKCLAMGTSCCRL